MPKDPKAPSKADEKAAAEALAARVAAGARRAEAFARATQGSARDGKPGCKPRYPEAKA
jgi:hypothetical protein